VPMKTLLSLAIVAILATSCHVDEYLRGTEAAKGPCGPTGVSCVAYDSTRTCCPQDWSCTQDNACTYRGDPGGMFGASTDGGAPGQTRPRTPER